MCVCERVVVGCGVTLVGVGCGVTTTASATSTAEALPPLQPVAQIKRKQKSKGEPKQQTFKTHLIHDVTRLVVVNLVSTKAPDKKRGTDR